MKKEVPAACYKRMGPLLSSLQLWEKIAAAEKLDIRFGVNVEDVKRSDYNVVVRVRMLSSTPRLFQETRTEVCFFQETRAKVCLC